MITTSRNALVGGHVTPEMKESLKRLAKEQNCSVSQLLYNILRDMLKSLGYPVGKEKKVA